MAGLGGLLLGGGDVWVSGVWQLVVGKLKGVEMGRLRGRGVVRLRGCEVAWLRGWEVGG